MKKLVAFLLAVMMLMTAAASAETASVFTFLDPVLTIDSEDGLHTIDLTGLKVDIAATDGEPAYLRITAQGNGESLLDMTAQIVNGNAWIAIAGVSRALYAELPEIKAAGPETVTEAGLSGVDLSGVMDIIMSKAELTANEDGSMTFKVPCTAMNEILEAIAPVLESVSIPGVDLTEVTSTFAQLKESNSGVDAEGRFAQDDDSIALNLVLTAVQDGEPTDAKLVIDSSGTDDGVSLDIDAAGQALVHIDAGPDNGYIALNLSVAAEGKSMSLKVKLSASEEEEADFADIDTESAVSVQELGEQNEELTNELSGALGNLISFVFTALAVEA